MICTGPMDPDLVKQVGLSPHRLAVCYHGGEDRLGRRGEPQLEQTAAPPLGGEDGPIDGEEGAGEGGEVGWVGRGRAVGEVWYVWVFFHKEWRLQEEGGQRRGGVIGVARSGEERRRVGERRRDEQLVHWSFGFGWVHGVGNSFW